MYLSISTTRAPATDLGFILMKHPDRVHEVDLKFGKATVFFPAADAARCEATLIMDVDPVGLVRGNGGDGLLDQYVNDRPYAVSSFLSVAINRAFRTAMTGVSRERPELAASQIPLEIRIAPLPTRGGEELIRSLFEPLGWTVALDQSDSQNMTSRYGALTLSGSQRVADALSHLYVLMPVLDGDKHYWVGDDEVEKLVAKGRDWLASHPAKELIARRYLKNRRTLTRAALQRLEAQDADEESNAAPRSSAEESLETPLRLNDLRIDAVMEALNRADAKIVADLGCGEGKLLARLMRDRRFSRLYGLDASMRSLERARDRLNLDPGVPASARVQLLHGALTYRDMRWADADAAILVEVIEHLEADRLPALAEVIFGAARPKTVIVTTPNVECNALFPALAAGRFRHPDHRFEWTRAEFRAWTAQMEARYGYRAAISGIGADDALLGAPTQMAVFTR